MKKYKRITILFLVFVLFFSFPLSVCAEDFIVSEEDRTKFDLFFGKDNWTVNNEGYAECKNWDNTPSNSSATKKVDDILTTGLGFTALYKKGGIDSVFSGTQFANWLEKHVNTDIKVDKTIYDNSKEDFKVTINKDAMKELHDSLAKYIYPMQGYYVLTQTCSKSEMKNMYSFGIGYERIKTAMDEFVDTHDNLILSKDNGTQIISFLNAYAYIVPFTWPYLQFVDSSLNAVALNFTDYPTIGDHPIVHTSTQISHKYLKAYCGAPVKIFYSKSDLQIYLNKLKGDGEHKIYVSNNFFNYSPTDFSFNMSNYNNIDYGDINNNTYNTINNEQNSIISAEGSITDVDLQAIVDAEIKKAMDQITVPDPDVPPDPDIPPDPPDPDNPDIDTTEIVDLLKLILTKIGNVNDSIINNFKSSLIYLSNLNETTKQISDHLLNINNDLNDKLDQIIDKLGGKTGDSFLDLLKDILSETVGNLLSDLIKLFIGEDGISGAVLTPAKSLASSAQARFPTCIPWDIVAIIGTFSAEPETPVFELPLNIPKLGIDEKITIDFSKADSLAKLSRTMLILTFLLFLLIQTRKLYGAVTGKK